MPGVLGEEYFHCRLIPALDQAFLELLQIVPNGTQERVNVRPRFGQNVREISQSKFNPAKMVNIVQFECGLGLRRTLGFRRALSNFLPRHSSVSLWVNG